MNRLAKWRRKSIGSDRFRVSVQVSFSAQNVEGTGMVRNLALRGALIETRTPVTTDSQLALSMTLAKEGVPLNLPAAVRWVRDDQVGVEFLKLDAEAFQQLSEYLFGVKNAADLQPKAA